MSQGNFCFCHHCGVKLIIGSNFCNKCGTSLASLSNKPEPPPPTPVKKVHQTFSPFQANAKDDDDDNPYDNAEHFNTPINALELDIKTYPIQGDKLGSIAAREERPLIEQRGGPVGKLTKRKQQEFLNQFAQEAGSVPAKPGQSTSVGE